MKKKATILLLVLAVLVAQTPVRHASGKEKEVKLSIQLSARERKTARLKGLPRSAVIQVDIKGDAQDTIVSLINQADLVRFPAVEEPLFQGEIQQKLSFTVQIPSAGEYYLAFENRSKLEGAKFTVTIRASTPSSPKAPRPALPKEEADKLERSLSQISLQLNKLFIFKPFPIKVKSCGEEKAFTGPDGVVLCLEFVRKIQDTMKTRDKVGDVLLFTIFHEVAHILLSQWKYPFFDNEEVSDEFASVLMIMLKQKERLDAMAEYFALNPASQELQALALRGDRHPLSIQRARNILNWTRDPDLVKKWQTVFVPHMQTALLEQMKKTPPPWGDLAEIDKELARRKLSPENPLPQ